MFDFQSPRDSQATNSVQTSEAFGICLGFMFSHGVTLLSRFAPQVHAWLNKVGVKDLPSIWNNFATTLAESIKNQESLVSGAAYFRRQPHFLYLPSVRVEHATY